MDLELILRAVWRWRYRLAACVLGFAIVTPLAAALLISAKYSSSTDITVFPAPDINSSVQSTYQLDPDRYVATQIAIISSRESEAAVASKLHVTTDLVGSMVKVAQVAKSDVIHVTATSTSAALSAKVAADLSNNYVSQVLSGAETQYKSAINSTDQQISDLQTQITAAQKQISSINENTSSPGPLQSALSNLLAQEGTLTTRKQQLTVDSQTVQSNTQVVSSAAVSNLPVGLTTTKLVAYGGALGFGLAVLVIALSVAPGKTLDDLDSTEDVGGVPVIGVFDTKGSGLMARLRGPTRNQAREVRNIRIASEIRTIIRLKGPLVVLRVGREAFVSRATTRIIELIHTASGEVALSKNEEIAEGDLIRDASLKTSASFLEMHPDFVLVVLGIDVATVSPAELLDVLALLRSFGVEVIGLVGVR